MLETIEELAEFIENVTGANTADNKLADFARELANITADIPLDELKRMCVAKRLIGKTVWCGRRIKSINTDTVRLEILSGKYLGTVCTDLDTMKMEHVVLTDDLTTVERFETVFLTEAEAKAKLEGMK